MLFRSTLTFLLVIPAVVSKLGGPRIRTAIIYNPQNDVVNWELESTTTTVVIASKMVLDPNTNVPALENTLPGTNIITTGTVDGTEDIDYHFSQSCTVLEGYFSENGDITTKKSKCFLDICAGKSNNDSDSDSDDAVRDCVYLQMSGYFGAGAITASTSSSADKPYAPEMGAADKGKTTYSVTGGTGRFGFAKGEAIVSQKGSMLNVALATFPNEDYKMLWA